MNRLFAVATGVAGQGIALAIFLLVKDTPWFIPVLFSVVSAGVAWRNYRRAASFQDDPFVVEGQIQMVSAFTSQSTHRTSPTVQILVTRAAWLRADGRRVAAPELLGEHQYELSQQLYSTLRAGTSNTLLCVGYEAILDGDRFRDAF